MSNEIPMSYDLDEFKSSEYSEIEVEALQELSNIGVGHAATALSQLLHRRVDMSIPYVKLVKVDKFVEVIADSPETIFAGVLVDTSLGDKMLNYLLLLDENSTKNILRILKAGEPPNNLSDIDDISKSIIQETGNILLLHNIVAINSFTDSTWFPNVPQLSIDMIGSIMDEVIGRERYEKSTFLQVECDIYTDEETIRGIILIIPNNKGLKLLMDKLYGEGWDLEE